jgi:hypothetical protein
MDRDHPECIIIRNGALLIFPKCYNDKQKIILGKLAIFGQTAFYFNTHPFRFSLIIYIMWHIIFISVCNNYLPDKVTESSIMGS